MKNHLHELIAARLTRRGMLKGTSGITASALLGISTRASAEEGSDTGFKEISAGYDENVHWPSETHVCDLVISWGDPIHAGGPAWEKGRTTPAAQAVQFGDNCDFIAFMPLPAGSADSDKGLLVVNHEFTRAVTMFVGHKDPKEPGRVQSEMNGHGMTVVEVERTSSGWAPALSSKYNRRITAQTPFELTGPVAGHERVKTSADPLGKTVLGTLANCAGGTTPWGTALSGEENVHVYWSGEAGEADEQLESRRAMKINGKQNWFFSEIDPRFDLQVEPNEPNRFGWVVEVDPYDPESVPKKRTAMGRFFHEGAEIALDKSGFVVAYMGDDTADEHLYRFVSERKFDPAHPEKNRDLLSAGTLSVAVFEDKGLHWAPLVHEGVLAERFTSLADILIDTRIAAKLVGATPMDRPERVAVSPVTNKVYVMLTKNPGRKTAMGPNGRVNNYWGQILEIDPGPGGHIADKMDWEILLEGGGGEAQAASRVHPQTTSHGTLSCPDNAVFDNAGRLWVTTDGNPGVGRRSDGHAVADGLYLVGTAGSERGRSRLFFRGCVGAELTGPCFTPDNSTLFLSVQHPGRGEEGVVDTCWPAASDAGVPPRSTVVALRRKNGGSLV